MGVFVEGIHEIVDFFGELCNVNEAPEVATIDSNGLHLVRLEDDEFSEVSGEGAEDDGRTHLGGDKDLLVVVKFGGT